MRQTATARRRFCTGLIFLVLLLAAISSFGQMHSGKILVFSKTAGWRHDSIPVGIETIRQLGTNHHFGVDATEDSAAFTDANLAQYQAVVFLSTTGDVLEEEQQAAFERFIRGGKGYAGVHAASDTEYDWPWYGALVGAYFEGHPSIQQATIAVADAAHPSTASLPKRWVRSDEWYNFQSNPRGKVHVLATLDERTYSGGGMGFDHPTAWCHEYDGGRAWYTGGGHTAESYAEPLFQAHLLGGVEYAAGWKSGDGGATLAANFRVEALDTELVEPMSLAVASDGRVFYVERAGRIKIYKPETSSSVIAGQVPVFSQLEDGLLGIALDPGFATNHWIYLMYSPSGSAPKQHVSRFTVTGDIVDMASEKVLLEIPTQRDECCHSAGSLAFGPDGTLYISTGDNTNPFASEGYAPIDERFGQSAWDAQKSSANANDLRGKILRIRPNGNGTYAIPDGNLFPTNSLNTRPEIYVMGCRNPFRISVDAATGWLYWGDVGPDANNANPNRGPAGYDEWNQARTAGNYGWPYFIANNKPYREYNFANQIVGAAYHPAFPTNNSPNNTGPQLLPPAQPAWIWYPYGVSAEFPELGDQINRTAFAGPVYHFDPMLASTRKLPAYYDKTLFIYDMWRNYIKEVKLDDAGQVLKINPFLTNAVQSPIDMEMGPDGALYILEWTTPRLTRIAYAVGQTAPVAVASASPASGSLPLLVQFSSAGSAASGTNPALTFAWSFFGNGVTNSTAAHPVFTYTQPGNYNAQLTVTDAQGNAAVANVAVAAGNNRPVVTIHAPPHGAFFDWGQLLHYRASASDVEDGGTANGSISCSRVILESWLGHNEHAHSQGQFSGCEGSFPAPPLDADEIGNLYLRLDASYLDNGATGVAPLRGLTTYTLQPKRKEAEYFTRGSGVVTQLTGDFAGGRNDVANIDDGDWISFSPINLTNIHAITGRVKGGLGGDIEIRLDATNGPLLSTISVPNTIGLYADVTAEVSDPGGTHELFLVFRRDPDDLNLFVLNWLHFQGAGVTLPIFLQSAEQASGPFTDDATAQIDFAAQTMTVAVTKARRFYRLRSAVPLEIESIQVAGGNVVMKYRTAGSP